MKKILVIPRYMSYDDVSHAGGKISNYNLKKLNREKCFEVKVLSFCKINELNKLDYEKYNIDAKVICKNDIKINGLKNKILNIYRRYVPFDKYGNLCENDIYCSLIKNLKKYKKNNYIPDIIILEWTQVALFIKDIKKIYPNSKIIIIEHDICFQGYERKVALQKKIIKKLLFNIRLKKLKKIELNSLKICDNIIVFNDKDKNLIEKNGVKTPITTIVPYYNKYTNIKLNYKNKNLLYYGSMNRPENYLSCIWLIENVFNDLLKNIPDIKLYIVGNNPPKELIKYESENIIITGFVDNPIKYFEKSICLVAPLVLGAGIKIKVLEAMSSGLVVLTNHIGIEGIPAHDGKEYFHCETKEDYYKRIINILENPEQIMDISKNAKNFLNENFSIEKGYNCFKELLTRM